MRCRRILMPLAIAALTGACATTATLGPAGIARLQADQAANPRSASVNRALGIAYFKGNQYPEARAALEKAAAIDPTDGTTQLFLGMTAEAQNDFATARAAYSSYIKHGRTARVRHQLEDRLAALNQKELTVAAREQVANEAALSSTPPSPTTIAVLPLQFTGADTTLRPLGRGLAELLSTDLAQSTAIKVVERERMQALLDEIQLQQSGAADQATGVRAGRMLQAGRIVAGGITQLGSDLRVDAPIVNTATDQVVASPTDTRTLDQLFTLEQNLAFSIFESLGVTLTTAQRVAIEQRPTKSMAAFLAYSRGLTFEDEGRFDDASRLFNQAVGLDPGFAAAAQRQQQSQAAAQGQNVTAATVESSLQGSGEGQVVKGASQGRVVADATGGLASTALTAAASLNPSTAGSAILGGGTTTTTEPPQKNPAAAGTGGGDVTAKIAVISIVIHIPHP